MKESKVSQVKVYNPKDTPIFVPDQSVQVGGREKAVLNDTQAVKDLVTEGWLTRLGEIKDDEASTKTEDKSKSTNKNNK